MLANKEFVNENSKMIHNKKRILEKNYIIKPDNQTAQEKMIKQQNDRTTITKQCSKLDKMVIDDCKENQQKMEIDSDGNTTVDQSKSKIKSLEIFKVKKETYLIKHQDKLNEILISNYGTEIYDFSIELEKLNYFPAPLKKHKIDVDIRTKMIDWMLEVLSAYNSEYYTFNLSVQILDIYIAKCNSILTNNDLHLIGIVSMFIASKMEDICPIRMSHVRTKISHGKFSEKDIRKKERAVLEALNFEVITTSTSDFIKTFIFDFIHNNRIQIAKLDMWHHIDAFENVTIFLSKLIQHSVEFNKYK